MVRRAAAVAATIAILFGAAHAQAAGLVVYATGSMEVPLHRLGEDFTRQTGIALTFVLGTTGVVLDKLKTGKADVIVISAEAADGLEKAGRLVAATRRDVSRSVLGVAVRKGSSAPDISSEDAFRRAVLAAPSLSYPDPSLGATSGIYLERLFARLGIADEAKRKTVVKPVGAAVADAVAKGEVALGLTFVSELIANPGVTVVGPFPAAVQNATLYTAGVAAESVSPQDARAFIAFITTPAAATTLKALGVEPVARVP